MASTEGGGEAPDGDFIFINHNAKRLRTIKDRSHRATVNQHVQRARLKNERLKVAKGQQLRKRISLNLGCSHDSEQELSNMACSTPPYKTCHLFKFHASFKQPRSQKDELPENIPFAAFNILTHGNSDPFNTLAIPLDATVSYLLQYSKEVMIPSVYSMEVRSTTPSLGIAKAWEHVTLAFEDECAISAYLSISATSIMRVAPSPDLVRVALKYNNRSSALLRQRIANNTVDPRIYIIVLWLSANALVTGDYTAGMVHANILYYLVRQGGGIASVEPFQRENILQFDVQFAMMFLRHPFFDAKDYAPGPFKIGWLNDPEAVENPSSSNTLHIYSPLTSSLASPELISTMTSLRTLYAVYTFTLHNGIPGTSPMLRWMYLQKHAVEAQLLEFCCNLIYSPISATNSETAISTPPVSEAEAEYTSLLPPFCIAVLYWTAMAVGYSKQKIHACSVLLMHLRSLLSNSPAQHCIPETQNSSNSNATLRLWILYVGCLAEQAMGVEQAPGKWENWCTQRFVRQMWWMGITSHEWCQEILESVLFSERMHRETGERTVWGKEDVLFEGNGVIEKWWGTDRKETGFEEWWTRVRSQFGGIITEEERL